MPRKKLTDQQIQGILYGRRTDKLTLLELAGLYGVSKAQVWRIVNGQRRSKVGSPLRSDPTPASVGGRRIAATEADLMAFLRQVGIVNG
jgi:hypothetical protein